MPTKSSSNNKGKCDGNSQKASSPSTKSSHKPPAKESHNKSKGKKSTQAKGSPVSKKKQLKRQFGNTSDAVVESYASGGCGKVCAMIANTVNVGITTNRFERIVEHCILSHSTDRSDDFNSSNPPLSYKLYCLWAFYTRIRQRCLLRGAYAMSFPSFPDAFYVPNGVWAALQYYAPYHEESFDGRQVQSNFLHELATEPTGNNGCIDGGTPTGFSVSASGYKLGYKDLLTVQREFNYIYTLGVAQTLSSAIANGFYWSERIAMRGGSTTFGSLPPMAPDASAYASWDTNAVNMFQCHTTKFHPEVAKVLATNTFTDATRVNSKMASSTRMYYTSNPLAKVDMERSYAFSWVFLTSHMKMKPNKALTKYLNYKGKYLKTISVATRVVDLSVFHDSCVGALSQLTHLAFGTATCSNELLYLYHIICDSVLMAATQPHRAMLDTSYTTSKPMSSLFSNAWLQAKIPAPIAYYIQQLAPVVFERQLYVPQVSCLVNRSAAQLSADGIQEVGASIFAEDLFSYPYSSGLAPLDIAIDGVVINAAWLAAFSNPPLSFWNLAPAIINRFHELLDVNRQLISDSLSSVVLNDFGSAALLANTVRDTAVVSRPVATGYTLIRSRGIKNVGSAVQLHNIDLAEAVLHGYVNADQNAIDDELFKFTVPGSRGGSNYTELVIRETMQANGAYARAVAVEKEQIGAGNTLGEHSGARAVDWLRETLRPIYSSVLRDIEGVLPEAYEMAKGQAMRFASYQLKHLATSGAVYYLGGRHVKPRLISA